MFLKTTTRTVVFYFPFELPTVGQVMPPGSYEIDTEEELISGLSFQAYRRISTTMTLDISTAFTSIRQVVEIDPTELELAINRDAALRGNVKVDVEAKSG